MFNLFTVQLLNGAPFGVLLFLATVGLTLVFGVMDFITLAHGVQYMPGAYLAVAITGATGSLAAGIVLAPAAAPATFGLILLLNPSVKMIFGAAPLSPPTPDWLSGSIALGEGVLYPVYRFAIIAAGLGVAGLLRRLVEKTRAGMPARVGAIRGAFFGAMPVGLVDTLGRSYCVDPLRLFMGPAAARGLREGCPRC